MLNEIQEVHEYLYDFDAEGYEYKRIKWPVFFHNNDWNGLERFMTMIARYFIFADGVETAYGRRRAEAAIRMWLGLSDGLENNERLAVHYEYIKDNYPWIEHWLYRYLKGAMIDEPAENRRKVEDFLESMKKKEAQFSFRSLINKGTTSDFKLIRYDKVLANAQVARGPLWRCYLVHAVPDWKAGTGKIVGSGNIAKVKDKDEDKILKLTAAYLIERNRKVKGNDDYVPEAVSFTDVAMWAAAKTRLDSTKFKMFTYEDSQTHNLRPLFTFRPALSGNLTKVMPDSEWLEYCGWDIIEATENDDKLDEYLDAYPNAVFYSDPGSCRELLVNERYPR